MIFGGVAWTYGGGGSNILENNLESRKSVERVDR